MTAGRALLALCVWMHFFLVVWVCFLLPTQGNWMHKLEAARSTELLMPLMIATVGAGWWCRERRFMLLTALVLAGIDGLLWASRYGL